MSSKANGYPNEFTSADVLDHARQNGHLPDGVTNQEPVYVQQFGEAATGAQYADTNKEKPDYAADYPRAHKWDDLNIADAANNDEQQSAPSLPFNRTTPVLNGSLLTELLTQRLEGDNEEAKSIPTHTILKKYQHMGHAFDNDARNPAHRNELSLILHNAYNDGIQNAQNHGRSDVTTYAAHEAFLVLTQFLNAGGKLDPDYRSPGGSTEIMGILHYTGLEGWNMLHVQGAQLSPGARNNFYESEATVLRGLIVKDQRSVEISSRGGKVRAIVEYPTNEESFSANIAEREYNQMAEEQAQVRRAAYAEEQADLEVIKAQTQVAPAALRL